MLSNKDINSSSSGRNNFLKEEFLLDYRFRDFSPWLVRITALVHSSGGHHGGHRVEQNCPPCGAWEAEKDEDGGRRQDIPFKHTPYQPTPSNQIPSTNSPFNYESICGFIHQSLQSPHDPVTCGYCLYQGPNLQYLSLSYK